MSCEEWLEPISAYVDGECDATEGERVRAHLARCSACSASLDRAERLRRRLLVGRAGGHDDLSRSVLARDVDARRAVHRVVVRRAVLAGVAALVAIVAAAIVVGGSPGPGEVASGDAGSTAHEVVVDVPAAFSDAEVHIHPGDTVEWRNEGAEPHELVHEIEGTTVSGTLEPGQSEAITFERPGSYAYRCDIHETIAGQVLVAA